MARRVIEIPSTKETFIFDDEWNTPDGRVKQLQYQIQPGGKVHPHFHPHTVQWFEVVSGELEIQTGCQTLGLQPGQRLQTALGGVHSQRNTSQSVAVVIEGYEPPLDIEPFFQELPKVLGTKNLFKICIFFDEHKEIVASQSLTFRYLVPLIAKLGRILRSRKTKN